MTFPQISKYTAVVLLILGFIGSFYLAEELSTSTQLVPKYEYISLDDYELKEVKNDVIYASVLISTWVGSLVLCLSLYGIGLIVEELRQANTYTVESIEHIEENKEE